MKKLIAILLAVLLFAGVLAGCANDHRNEKTTKKTEAVEENGGDEPKDDEPKDDETEAKTEAKTEKPDNTVKGKWVLTSETVRRQREKYTSDEFTSTYTVELYEHTYEHTYTPDPEDPSDGTTPYSASFLCSCAIPTVLYPGDTDRFSLSAITERDEKPGSNDGMCCSIDFRGITPEPKITSTHGYDYSRSMYYPICAGSTIEYGHLEDTGYAEDMLDFIDVTMPVITKDMNPNSYDVLTVTFMSNAGESEFVYTWAGED